MTPEEQAMKLIEPYGLSGHDIDPGMNKPTYITIYDAITLLMTQLERIAELEKQMEEVRTRVEKKATYVAQCNEMRTFRALQWVLDLFPKERSKG